MPCAREGALKKPFERSMLRVLGSGTHSMPFAGGGTGAGGSGGSSALTCQAHAVRQAETHALPPLLRLVGALHVLCLQCGRRHRRGGGQHGAAAVPARVCGAAPIPAALRPPANCPCSLLTSNTLNSWCPKEMACSWAPCAPPPLLSATGPASACAASGRAAGVSGGGGLPAAALHQGVTASCAGFLLPSHLYAVSLPLGLALVGSAQRQPGSSWQAY
jgi:hypothetical protein